MNNVNDKEGKKHDVKLSRMLSKLLRHQLMNFKNKLNIKDGYVEINSILRLPNFKGYSKQDVFEVCKADAKQRFNIKEILNDGAIEWRIKANQGHSFELEDKDLKIIINHEEIPVAIHGTTLKNWELIKSSGELNKMKRAHIHLAPGMLGQEGVISGMRYNCEVYIHIDTKSALEAGVPFFISLNKVILTPGPIPINLFSKVLDSNLNEIIYK